ncbi:MAG: Rrf2 family transcriptional regulator [Clostridia bacterium]|nr:Rrf2 family transcriptional regulator [Clostridia bacterium]
MVSTKGRYALRVMLDLAEHADEGFIPLKDIALRQEVSKKYLEIIVRDLVGGKLIRGSSGKGGGYRLCRRPQDYTVGEIIELTEGTLAPIACLAADAGNCPRKDRCKTLPFWHEFDTMVHDFFYSRRLSDFLSSK